MHIPANLPRFKEDKALLISTGKQVGRIYYAANGTVTEFADIAVPTPVYSDREGFFARSGSGRTYGSGAPYEPRDEETKKKFLRELALRVKEIIGEKNVSEVYLFSPNYAIKELKEELPGEVRKKIRFAFMGNFVKFGPLELLRKIDGRLARLREKSELRDPEAAKILSRPRSQGRLRFA